MTSGISLALLASTGWGTSDFLGGLASRSLPMPVVLAVSQLAGLACLIPVLAWTAAPELTAASAMVSAGLALAFAAGVISVAELGLIYLALRRGPVIVIAPITAVGAALPVTAGIVTGDRVTTIVAAGLTCCLAGAVTTSWVPGEGERHPRGWLPGALIAGGAAIGVGAVLTLIGVAARTAAGPFWVIGAVRAGGVVTSLLWLAWSGSGAGTAGHARPIWRRTGLLTAAGAGVADLIADAGYVLAARGGVLSVVAVVASLSPVPTIILGWLVLREPARRIPLAGAAIACAGVALLASAAR